MTNTQDNLLRTSTAASLVTLIFVVLLTFIGFPVRKPPVDPFEKLNTPKPEVKILAHVKHETEVCKDIRECMEEHLKGGHVELEYRLDDGARVDIFTEDYAIEVDWAPKWAESIGQSLYYGKTTNKRSVALIIVEEPVKDMIYLRRLKAAVADLEVEIWTYDMGTLKLDRKPRIR